MARLPDLIPIPDFWPIQRFGAHGNLTAVEYLSPAHLSETDVHAKHTRDRLAEFDPELVSAIRAGVKEDLAFFADVFARGV